MTWAHLSISCHVKRIVPFSAASTVSEGRINRWQNRPKTDEDLQWMMKNKLWIAICVCGGSKAVCFDSVSGLIAAIGDMKIAWLKMKISAEFDNNVTRDGLYEIECDFRSLFCFSQNGVKYNLCRYLWRYGSESHVIIIVIPFSSACSCRIHRYVYHIYGSHDS